MSVMDKKLTKTYDDWLRRDARVASSRKPAVKPIKCLLSARTPGRVRWGGWGDKPHKTKVVSHVIPPDRLDEFLQSGLTASDFLKNIEVEKALEILTSAIKNIGLTWVDVPSWLAERFNPASDDAEEFIYAEWLDKEAVNRALDKRQRKSHLRCVRTGRITRRDINKKPTVAPQSNAAPFPEAKPKPESIEVPAKVYEPSTEMAARDKTERLACEWMAKHLNGCLEVNTPVGRIDVLSESTVYEVKQARNWKHALGQVLAYGHYFPDLKKVIVLVGKVDQFTAPATYHCGLFGVDVLNFDDI